jgi:DNA mismatch endonuclease (patch repair protein)
MQRSEMPKRRQSYGETPTSPGRSRNMRAVKRADTRQEVGLRSALHRRGWRFRKDLLLRFGPVRVRPDIVFPRRKVAVFVDGCFWHSCPIHGSTPKVNVGYWSPKLQRNVERDHRNNITLEQNGWQSVRIWEHEDIEEAVSRVESALADT